MKPSFFENPRPDLKRLNEIIRVLVKYQFGNILEESGIKKSIKTTFLREKDFEKELDSTAPLRFRLVLEELGTTFIKLGQVLSTRPDLVGREMADELAKLQDEVPPFSFESVKKVFETELEKPLNSLFIDFEETPIASASIAQVHKARLMDEREVAVKVQRPNLKDQIEKDINIMRYIAVQADKRVRKLKYYNVPGIVDEFERVIWNEMDFYMEARNIERFRSIFQDNEHVYAPEVYTDQSTDKVLTMEFIDGVKVSEALDSDLDVDGRKLAEIGTECYFRQIFIDGFFHADPHPGNILVQKGDVLCFVDFGMVGHLEQDFMDNLAELFIFTVNYDVNSMVNQMRYMKIIGEDADTDELKSDIIHLLDKFYGREIKDIGALINEFSMPDLVLKYKMRFPKDFILLGRVLAVAEDIGVKLDPSFNGMEVAKPMIRKILKKRLSPIRILNYQNRYFFEIEHIMKDLPQTINQILFRMSEGRLNMVVEVKEAERFRKTAETMVNRIVLALIVSSLIIGSSLILQTNKGMPMPVIGFSTVGLVIFLIAAFLAIILIIMILRKGRV